MRRCSVCFRRLAGDLACPRHPSTPVRHESLAAPESPEPPGIPGYILAEPLGAGAHATVWRAQRDSDGATVAVKVTATSMPHTQERARRERDMLARIGPPHVPALLDHGALADGRVYLVMEVITGPDLGTLLAGMRTWPTPERAAALADALLAALAAVHGAGIVHGDLTPENIVIEESDRALRAVLLDFGLARKTGEHGPDIPAAAAGTLLYMAPEQIEGAPVDPQTDVYAAGVILFELLALRPPFGGDSTTVELGHRTRRPRRPSAIAPVARPVEDVILRCLAKDRAQRPRDAGALRDALARAFAEIAGAAPGPVVMEPSRPTPVSVSRPGRKGRDTRRYSTVAVAFLQAAPGAAHALQDAIEATGGWLAEFADTRYAVVFTHEATDNPVRRAVEVAQSFVTRGLCRRAIIDLVSVLVRWRANGHPWFVSSLFSQVERFPGEADPEGVTLTDAVTAALPSLRGDIPGPAVRAAHQLGAGETPTPVRAAATPFVGRQPLLEDLLVDFRTALREAIPGLSTVMGEPGQGKSYLAAILAEGMSQHYPWVQLRELRAYPPIGGDRAPLLRELLTWTLGLPTHSPSDAGLELLRHRLGPQLAREVWCGVALAMGWLSLDAAPVRALEVAPGTLRTATARALGEALVRLGAKRPHVLILDDAHWADDTVLDAIEYATAAGQSAEIWCLVLARPSFADLRPDWGQRAARHQELRLEALSREAARELCRNLLQPALDVPEAVIDRLVTRADHNPMLLVELVRGLARHGLVKPGGREAGWHVDTDVLDTLPDAPLLDWLTRRELDALSPEQAAHARLVSLLGAEFTIDAVEGVLNELDRHGRAGKFPLDARIGVEQLVDRGILLASRRGTFGFRHQLICEAVAATVEPGAAADIHHAAYEYYRISPQVSPAERLARLAWHAEQHGARDAALAAYTSMAEEARAKHEYLRAEQLFTRVLALLDHDDARRRVQAHRGRGIMRYRLSRHQDAIDDLERARACARSLGDDEAEIHLLLDQAMALDWLAHWERAGELTDTARELLSGDAAPALEARVLMSLGRAAVRAEDLERATALFRDAVARAEPLAGDGYETLVVSQLMLGGLYAWLDRLDDAEQTFEQVITRCRARSDTLHLATALGNRVHLWAIRGDWQRLAADLEEGLMLARVLGNVLLERNAHYNVAAFHYWRGELHAARTHLDRLLDLDARRGGRELRPEASLLQARIELAAGDLDMARAIAADIRAQQAWAEGEGRREALLRPSDRLLLSMVELAVEGVVDDLQWDELFRRALSLSVAQELVEIRDAQACAAVRAGNNAAARSAWQTALATAQSSAAFMIERIQHALSSLRAASAGG